MRLAFAGSHRTGKSTLARYVEGNFGLPFIATSTSELTKELDVDLKADLTFDQRLDYQKRVLDRLWEDLDRADMEHGSFVTDRSFVDAAAYLLADVRNVTGTHAQRQAILDYVRECVDLNKQLFTTIILVPPAIALTEDANKGAANAAYQAHHHLLIRGLLCEDTDDAIDWQELPRASVSLEARYEFVKWVLGRFDVKPLTVARAA